MNVSWLPMCLGWVIYPLILPQRIWYITDSLCCTEETNTTLWISYTQIKFVLKYRKCCYKKVFKNPQWNIYILKIIITYRLHIIQGIGNRMASLNSNAEMWNIRKQCFQYSEGNTFLIHNAISNKTINHRKMR